MFFLIVDDDELSRELLTLLLDAEGYAVEAVASGDEALTLLSGPGQRPDVILADMQMPGLAGSALAAALREAASLGTLNETRILAMSGSRPPASSLDGFDGFLLKPFEISDLRALIEANVPLDIHASASLSTQGPMKPDDAPTGIPAINEDIYAKMCELMPGPQLGEMYSLCLGDARKRIAQMATLAAAGDDKQYRLEAHTIKGGAGMIGATELYTLAAAAEREGLHFDPKTKSGAGIDAEAGTSSVTAILDRFSRACERLERILVERKRK